MATVTTIPVKKTDDPPPPAPSGREMRPVQPVFPPPDHPPHTRKGGFGALKWFLSGISLFFIAAMLRNC